MDRKVKIQLAPGDRDRLEALIANGNTPQKHVRRARIVLLAGDGVGTDEIKRRLDVSKPTIRRWRTRYVEAGVDGLCREMVCSVVSRTPFSNDLQSRRAWSTTVLAASEADAGDTISINAVAKTEIQILNILVLL
jgi:hypothetical protein